MPVIRAPLALPFLAACLLAVLGMLVVADAQAQTFIYVNAGAVGGTGACTQPFGTIAEGITAARAAVPPTEIRVTGGALPAGRIYAERSLVLNFSNVALKGGYDATTFAGACDPVAIETARNAGTLLTVVDAQAMDRHLDVLPVRVDADGDTMVDDFAARNTGVRIDRIAFRNGQPSRALPGGLTGGSGGSMVILNCDVAISNSVFENNTSREHFFGGGAIYMVGYDTVNPTQFNACTLDLTSNLFIGNQTGAGFIGSGPGGAIFAFDANIMMGPTVQRLTVINATGNTFRNNVSNGSSSLNAAIYCLDGAGMPAPNFDCNGDTVGDLCAATSVGGAVELENVSGTWDGNTFDNNRALARQTTAATASGQGGAMAVFASQSPFQANPVIANNTFSNNVADSGPVNQGCGGFSAWGGAVYLAYFDTAMTGNTFANNRADDSLNGAPQGGWGGAALMIPLNSPVIDGNRFTANAAQGGTGQFDCWGGAIASVFNGGPIITNNVFQGNRASGVNSAAAYGGALTTYFTSGPYPVIAGNTFDGNRAEDLDAGGTFTGMGGAAFLQIDSPDAVIADNVIVNNTASTITGPFTFAGMVLRFTRAMGEVTSPLVQNNLIAENQGIGLTLFGRGGMTGLPVSPRLVNNTITANQGLGIAMNFANNTVIDSTIVENNDLAGTAAGADVLDEFIMNDGLSTGVVIRSSNIGLLPAGLASIYADPANRNFVPSIPPAYALGPGGNYYLDQASPLVDAGPVLAANRNFGMNPNMPGTMAGRTTDAGTEGPDTCFVDVGFHHSIMVLPADGDADGLPDGVEATISTDPADADSDDDGVLDGADCGGDVDMDGTIAALDCDADGDGLTDGTESGVTAAGADTNTGATCDTSNAPCGRAGNPTYTADSQPATRTDPLNADTDASGEPDGCEDADRDGRLDAGERDPNAVGDDDNDGDNFANGLETPAFTGTDPDDSDTDDDGVSDFDEFAVGLLPTNCDTDGDSILDGVELSMGPVAPRHFLVRGTDVPALACAVRDFAPDADPGTQTVATCPDPVTDCPGFDTDMDGCADGAEDLNFNGLHEPPGETDPNDGADCVPPGFLRLRVNASITALLGGSPTACAAATVPPAETVQDPPASCAPGGCAAFGITPTSTDVIPTAGDLIRAGEADSTFEPAVLVFYQYDGCTGSLEVTKRGADLVLRVN